MQYKDERQGDGGVLTLVYFKGTCLNISSLSIMFA